MHIFVYGASCGGSRVNFHESHKFPALAIPLQIQQGEIHVTHISTKREIQILDRNGGRGAVVEVMMSCLILQRNRTLANTSG